LDTNLAKKFIVTIREIDQLVYQLVPRGLLWRSLSRPWRELDACPPKRSAGGEEEIKNVEGKEDA